MALILHIETSENLCSIALSENDKLIIERIADEDKSHSSQLTVLINEAFESFKIKPSDLSAISVSIGPGSYTGLRIGVSVAKGIAYGLNIPIIAVDTLLSMCYGAMKSIFFKTFRSNDILDNWFCPMIDARRMEIYCGFFNTNFEQTIETSAEIINNQSFIEVITNHRVFMFGSGSEKVKSEINHTNAVFIDNIMPKASFLIPFAYQSYKNNDFVDVAYFEPFYLKDFVGTTSRKSLLSI